MIVSLLAALMAARCFAWAEAPAAWAETPAELPVGALVTAELDGGERTFRFTTGAGSVYDVCLYPAEDAPEDLTARLYQGDALLAEGAGPLTALSLRLSANTEYLLALSGAGRVRVEVARHALGRCFDLPLSLDAAGNDYSKAVARPGDAHWYALAAPEGRSMALTAVPLDASLTLEAMLFDEDGRLVAEAAPTAGGAFLADFSAADGRATRIRVSAPDGGTGLYRLKAEPLDGEPPRALALSETSLQLTGHESRALEATVVPEDAARAIYWESSDPGIAQVDQSGTVTGVRAGTAVVTAYAPGGVKARCRVEVARVPIEGIDAITSRIDMRVGDDVALEWRLVPENASETDVTFEVAPEGVVTVDASGVVRAEAEGEAVIRLRTVDGGFEDTARVRVRPAEKRWRALLIGEKNYAPDVAAVRLGSANSVAGLRSMLEGLSFSGARFEVDTRLDVSRDGALAAIRETFAGATEQDTALFYITCHGYYANGMTCFQMADGSVLTAQALRQALDDVPGSIVVFADCCGSGGVIGRASRADDILRGILGVFGGVEGPSMFAGSRYRVLASASIEQDSYRISFDAEAAETSMATAFARAVCEGGGWSLDRASKSALRADINDDAVVTLDELARYAARRVMWYLSLNPGDYAQSVQAFPEGDVRSLFERTEAS